MNETLDQQSMLHVVEAFYLLMAARYPAHVKRWAPLLADPRTQYESFIGFVESKGFEHLSILWVRYVRLMYPVAVEGFSSIGRLANAPKPEPGESPRLYPFRGLRDTLEAG